MSSTQPSRGWALAAECETITTRCEEVPEIRSISAVTFATRDMARAVRFYEVLGFSLAYGGAADSFSSFRVGPGSLNLARVDGRPPSPDGVRVIFYVDDVDAMYARVLAQGFTPEMSPRDAAWGERYFHLTDPDGHALSFARPLRDSGA
jgi:catechol 2,3-dioxygenase-like lactoylglutathione lyase family enzyme